MACLALHVGLHVYSSNKICAGKWNEYTLCFTGFFSPKPRCILVKYVITYCQGWHNVLNGAGWGWGGGLETIGWSVDFERWGQKDLHLKLRICQTSKIFILLLFSPLFSLSVFIFFVCMFSLRGQILPPLVHLERPWERVEPFIQVLLDELPTPIPLHDPSTHLGNTLAYFCTSQVNQESLWVPIIATVIKVIRLGLSGSYCFLHSSSLSKLNQYCSRPEAKHAECFDNIMS